MKRKKQQDGGEEEGEDAEGEGKEERRQGRREERGTRKVKLQIVSNSILRGVVTEECLQEAAWRGNWKVELMRGGKAWQRRKCG